MSIKVEKSNLALNQIITNKNENALIEGDCIVPDIKPDIMNIIETSGNVCIYKKEMTDGKIRIDGCVLVYVMYRGMEEGKNSIRSINHTLDFSQIIAIPEAKTDMNEEVKITLENINSKMVNERKINIKANLNLNIRISSNSNIEYISNIKVKDLQKEEKQVSINSLVGMGTTKSNISETITIDNSENLAEILKLKTIIKNTETKISYNKVLIKSDINVKIVYSTEDGNIRVTNVNYPVMGFIDMKEISDEDVINTNIEIQNIVIKPNGSQDHTISVDIEVGMGIKVYAKKTISIVKDMYSPITDLQFTQKEIKTLQNSSVINSVMNYSQKGILNIGDEKLYDGEIEVQTSDVKVENSEIIMKGNIAFLLLHSNNKMTGLENKKIELPYEYKVKCENIKSNANITINTSINNENLSVMPGGEIECRMDLNFRIEVSNNAEIDLIENVTESENKEEKIYNMVIYYTKAGDNLWKIAKQFKTTKQVIKTENDIKESNLKPGTQLFISRYVSR